MRSIIGGGWKWGKEGSGVACSVVVSYIVRAYHQAGTDTKRVESCRRVFYEFAEAVPSLLFAARGLQTIEILHVHRNTVFPRAC